MAFHKSIQELVENSLDEDQINHFESIVCDIFLLKSNLNAQTALLNKAIFDQWLTDSLILFRQLVQLT